MKELLHALDDAGIPYRLGFRYNLRGDRVGAWIKIGFRKFKIDNDEIQNLIKRFNLGY